VKSGAPSSHRFSLPVKAALGSKRLKQEVANHAYAQAEVFLLP
jgi:hypothetical protein